MERYVFPPKLDFIRYPGMVLDGDPLLGLGARVMYVFEFEFNGESRTKGMKESARGVEEAAKGLKALREEELVRLEEERKAAELAARPKVNSRAIYRCRIIP